MSIEFVPRWPMHGNGWRVQEPVRIRGAVAGPPVLSDTRWGRAVRVRVLPRRIYLLGSMPPWLVGAVVALCLQQALAHEVWWLVGALALVFVVAAYRALRLVRFSDHVDPDVILAPAGVGVGDVLVPWTEVVEVVRLHFLFGAGPEWPAPRNFLAVRVSDFVAVRGLSPFKAGLANLTRRHLLVLVETTEVEHPERLAHTIEALIAAPAKRTSLTRDAGLALLTHEGPNTSNETASLVQPHVGQRRSVRLSRRGELMISGALMAAGAGISIDFWFFDGPPKFFIGSIGFLIAGLYGLFGESRWRRLRPRRFEPGE